MVRQPGLLVDPLAWAAAGQDGKRKVSGRMKPGYPASATKDHGKNLKSFKKMKKLYTPEQMAQIPEIFEK